MHRKWKLYAIGFAAGVAAVAGVNLGANVASAGIHPNVTAQPLCESSGNMFCAVDSSGTQFLGSHGSAEPVKFNANGNTFTFNGVTYNVGTLNEPGLSPACLGTNGNGNITRQNCTTGTGIIWLAATSNGHDVWGNRKSIQDQGVFRALAASDSLNTVLFIADFPPANGVFERWDFG